LKINFAVGVKNRIVRSISRRTFATSVLYRSFCRSAAVRCRRLDDFSCLLLSISTPADLCDFLAPRRLAEANRRSSARPPALLIFDNRSSAASRETTCAEARDFEEAVRSDIGYFCDRIAHTLSDLNWRCAPLTAPFEPSLAAGCVQERHRRDFPRITRIWRGSAILRLSQP